MSRKPMNDEALKIQDQIAKNGFRIENITDRNELDQIYTEHLSLMGLFKQAMTDNVS